MANRFIQINDNPDLTVERKSCKFDIDELASRIYGSKKSVEDRRRILEAVELNPQLRDTIQDSGICFMSRLEKFENSYKKSFLSEKFMDRIIDRENVEQYEYYQKLVNGTSGHPFMLKHVIVIPLLENSADDEQRKLFLEPAKRHEFCSAYAQTELGHGTDTKNLETTAIFDPKTQEFVLNSPTTSSLKWWPGNLGKSASMAIVMASLITNGKNYGMHPFFVQIRCQETHELLPGVIAGDIGPTFANYVIDNGYLGFNQFRVPRNTLLAKHFKVHPDGRYEAAIHRHLAYTGMMFVRSSMIFDCGIGLAAGAIIATRYSAIRRQGEIQAGSGEVKILDYKTQQYRILPQLARAICFCLAGHFTTKLYYQVMEDIKEGDVSRMADLHAITSGLKAVCSYQVSIGVEQCRMACGGHGYSMASGLPQILTKVVAGCTYEGDNLVMLLQLARHLIKCAKEVKDGEKSDDNDSLVHYLYETSPYRSSFDSKTSNSQQWLQIQKAFEHLGRRLTFKAYDFLVANKGKCSQKIAWNRSSVELTKAARAHTRTFLSRNFIQMVENEKNKEIRDVLSDLLDVYLFYELMDCRADLLETDFMTPSQVDECRDKLNKSLSKLRLNAVNIADSFDLPDRLICSALGRRDGNVYENLFKWAQQSELNKTSVLPFHHQTLGKMMKSHQLNMSKL